MHKYLFLSFTVIKWLYFTLLAVLHLTLSSDPEEKGVIEQLSGHLAPSQGQPATGCESSCKENRCQEVILEF